jgi:hypothetical protein
MPQRKQQEVDKRQNAVSCKCQDKAYDSTKRWDYSRRLESLFVLFLPCPIVIYDHGPYSSVKFSTESKGRHITL